MRMTLLMNRACWSLTGVALLMLSMTLHASGFQPTLLAGGLDRVTEIRQVDAAGKYSYVAEQSGKIRLLQSDGSVDEVFLDISAQVRSTGFEQGLTGLAFAPTFPVDRSFYVHYIRNDGASVVSRFKSMPDDPRTADAMSEEALLVLGQPSPIHNCNKLEFGPDGYLYIGCGDGGPGTNPVNAPRDLTHLYGKILRVDVTSPPPGQAYGIPPDNPYAGIGGASPEIWASGLRNPYRFGFDLLTGDLWLGDVGQERQEELNRVPATAPFGVDFGWTTMEGVLCFRPVLDCDTNGIWLPIHTYDHVAGRCAIVVGPRLRGRGYGAFRDLVVFGDFCTGEVFALTERCGSFEPRTLGRIDAQITAFALGPDGDLLVGTYGIGTAQVFRIVAAQGLFGDGFDSPPECP